MISNLRDHEQTGGSKEPLVPNQDPKTEKADLLFENHFSLFLIRPVSYAGQQWLSENIDDGAQMLGNAIACEPRYVEAIFQGAMADGLVCR